MNSLLGVMQRLRIGVDSLTRREKQAVPLALVGHGFYVYATFIGDPSFELGLLAFLVSAAAIVLLATDYVNRWLSVDEGAILDAK